MGSDDLRQRAACAVSRAVEDLNELLPHDERLVDAVTTPLVGPSSRLDSLALVNLVVAVQRRIQEALGVSLPLADERLFGDGGAFRTLGSLTDYVTERLERSDA